MKIYVLLLCFFLNVNVEAQIKGTDLVGSWKISEVLSAKVISANEKKALNYLRPNLMKATFKFDAEGYGTVHMDMTNIPISKEFRPSGQIRWLFDEAKQRLRIFERKDPESLLAEVYVKKQNGSIYFEVGESKLILKVEKGT